MTWCGSGNNNGFSLGDCVLRRALNKWGGNIGGSFGLPLLLLLSCDTGGSLISCAYSPGGEFDSTTVFVENSPTCSAIQTLYASPFKVLCCWSLWDWYEKLDFKRKKNPLQQIEIPLNFEHVGNARTHSCTHACIFYLVVGRSGSTIHLPSTSKWYLCCPVGTFTINANPLSLLTNALLLA